MTKFNFDTPGKVLKVLALGEAKDMTLAERLEVAGLSEGTYYAYLREHPEAIQEITTIQAQIDRVKLGIIAIAETKILEKMITNALGSTYVADQISALRFVESMKVELNQKYGNVDEENDKAREFMNKHSIKLTVQSSDFRDVEVTIEGGDPSIIEGQFAPLPTLENSPIDEKKGDESSTPSLQLQKDSPKNS